MRITQVRNRFFLRLALGQTNARIFQPHSPHYISEQRLLLTSVTHIRLFHSSTILYGNESKIERTVNLYKNQMRTKPALAITTDPAGSLDPSSNPTTSSELIVVKRKSIRERIVHELKHYYNGFKLLFIETKIAFRLFRRVLNGHTLTRRERKQFTRTTADLFRLVPFSVFIIVPFLEFTLPIFLKLFPNVLPSTFKEADKEHEKLKKQMKVKLEVAKFLQDTLEATALKSKKRPSDDALPVQFVKFMKKIRSTGVQPSTEEIMKFSSLFENKSTLDNLDHPQLVALCKLIGLSSIGPDYYLRFTLHLKLRHLAADDKLIESEGIENLNVEELQAACRERGMRFYGVSIERLRSQLQQWLDLHLNQRIPSTILLLSRALYLPENISQENILKAAIQSLPKSIENVTAVKLAQVAGERMDNTQRIEYIKHEEQAIRREQAEIRAPVMKDEQYVDVGQFETALEQLVNQKAKEVHTTVGEIRELKDDVRDYKDDVKEFESIVATKQLKYLSETRSAKSLSKRIDKLVVDLDQFVRILDKKQDKLRQDLQIEQNISSNEAALKSDRIQQQKDFLAEKRDTLVSTQEFINTIRQIQKVSNEAADAQVWDIIHQFDHNRDGFIEADEILEALEIIGNEKVQISKKHLKEIIDLVRKEHFIEEKEKFQAQAKQFSFINSMDDRSQSPSTQI